MKFPVIALVVVALVVEARIFVKNPVVEKILESESVLAIRVAKAAMFPVTFVNVVEARVDDPVTSKFAAVSVPLLVDEPVISAVRTPVCAIKFVNVVDASVDEPVILKFKAVSVPELVEEEIFNPVKFAS